MARTQKGSRKSKLSKEDRATLKARLPNLLTEAASNLDVAPEALRACLTLRVAVPSALLTPENIAKVLSPEEIAKSLIRLSKTQSYLDLSSALSAARNAARKLAETSTDKRFLLRLSRSITSNVLKLAKPDMVGTSKQRGNLIPSQIRFTPSTLSAAADLALWIISVAEKSPKQTQSKTESLALSWVDVMRSLWRSSVGVEALSPVVEFQRRLRLTTSNPESADFFFEVSSAAIKEAPQALLDARLNDLESCLSAVARDENTRERYYSALREICQTRQPELLPEAVEWVARHVERERTQRTTPRAADESQAVALDYISMCLLSAWDAASEGEKSRRALENIRHMARELFKLNMSGNPGEVISYDERQHELKVVTEDAPERVKLLRPSVQWSDGLRSRIIVRALVEAMT
jgi:hypothetical protein